MPEANAPVDDILGGLQPPPAAPTEFVSSGYRFEHYADGEHSGIVTLSHPGCPRLAQAYGTRDCFTLLQAIQLIIYAYEKDYSR